MVFVLLAVAGIVTVLGALTLYLGSDPSLLTLGNTVMTIGAIFMGTGIVTFAIALAVAKLGRVARNIAQLTRAIEAGGLPVRAAPPAAELAPDAPDLSGVPAILRGEPALGVTAPAAPPATPGPSVAPALAAAAGGLVAGAAIGSAARGWAATADEPRTQPAPHEPASVATITPSDWRGEERTLSHAVIEAPIEAEDASDKAAKDDDGAPAVSPSAAEPVAPAPEIRAADAPPKPADDIEADLMAALGLAKAPEPRVEPRIEPALVVPPVPTPEPELEVEAEAEREPAAETPAEPVAPPVVTSEPVPLAPADAEEADDETEAEDETEPEPEPAAAAPASDHTDALQRGLEDLLKAPILPPKREEPSLGLDDDFLARLRDTAFRATPPPIPVVEPAVVEPVVVEPPPPSAPLRDLDLEAALQAALSQPLPTISGRPREERAEVAHAIEPAPAPMPEPVAAEEPAPSGDPALAKLARDFPELGDLLAPPVTRSAEELLVEPAAAPAPPIVEPPPVPAPPPAPEMPPLLREGVIAGIPFRLFGDGTIEADLPAGATRFATLKDFRAHVGG